MLLKLYSLCILFLDGISFVIKFILLILEGLYQSIFPPAEKSVEGEIVLVTGAGHGIGRQLALKYAGLGANVVCWDINESGNAETVAMISERLASQEKTVKSVNSVASLNGTHTPSKKVYGFKCDVSKREEVMRVAAKVKSEVGNVTVIVNNAGIMPCRPFLSHSQQEVQQVFNINVLAHIWILEAFLPSMIENNHGHVVALSSMAGMCGLSNLVPYCASKYAVRGLMEAISEELREEGRGCDIKFTTIFPFIVGTGLVQKPKVRFPHLLGVVSAEEAACKIVTSMRRNYVEVSIPSFLMYVNNFSRAKKYVLYCNVNITNNLKQEAGDIKVKNVDSKFDQTLSNIVLHQYFEEKLMSSKNESGFCVQQLYQNNFVQNIDQGHMALDIFLTDGDYSGISRTELCDETQDITTSFKGEANSVLKTYSQPIFPEANKNYL